MTLQDVARLEEVHVRSVQRYIGIGYLLRLSRDAVVKLVRRGDLRAIKLGDGKKCAVRFTGTEVERFVTARLEATR
jgi:Helix-turn-helix domain